MAKASQIFGALGKNVFRNKAVWRNVKAQIMVSMILPVLLDGSECCAISTKTMDEMETLYHRMIRSCLRITPYTQRKFRLSSENLLKKIGLRPLHYYLDLKVLAYAGHVQRMPIYRLPKLTRDGRLPLPQKRGRPTRNVMSCLKDSLKRKKIQIENWKNLAENKNLWASQIRKSQTHERARAKNKKCKHGVPEIWAKSPSTNIGLYVEKQYGTKWYVGTIVETNVDSHTNDQIWRVLYDDGDEEDYNAQQLAKIICPDMKKYL
jgi:hypothetical protein